ncbi:hypothetical protein [Burkholderia gladioli]|uniref:hypothetical protein n=1 Tax=Burkholderia gladioli TaxID=28095 RepID=UPI003B982975
MAEEFVIRIRADDAATATIKKIQDALGKVTAPVEKAQKRFANVGSVGLRSFEKLAKGLDSAARAAHSLVTRWLSWCQAWPRSARPGPWPASSG